MIFFYKSYPYSPIATLVSLVFSLHAAALIIGGVLLFKEAVTEETYLYCLIAVLLAAVGVLIYIFGSKKLSAKIAEKNGMKNIKTKAKYARRFVQEHPEAYEQLIRENPDFAEKYVRDESGKIVRR
ncbi:MAG: hypothetical protein K6G90_09680 [Clostridia bacterium]|nr:hypothetical protein [Clostridia bacterium]